MSLARAIFYPSHYTLCSYMVSLYHKVKEEFLQPNNPTTIRNTVAPTIQLHREAMEEAILFKLNMITQVVVAI